eukprot:gene12655-12782_t
MVVVVAAAMMMVMVRMQMVCDASHLQKPGDFLCGSLADVQYLLVRGQDGLLRAFHNVCRHHAAAVARGCGRQLQFECPYHGWTYDDRGRLVKATRLKGIKDFKASQFGLHPIALDVWGHFVFLHLQGGRPPPADALPHSTAAPDVAAWLGAGGQQLVTLGIQDQHLVHVARREYVINCNWKVFCDNYLVEDIALCEAVQLGLQEPAYGVGRYAPGPEAPMYHFHSQLYEQLRDAAVGSA